MISRMCWQKEYVSISSHGDSVKTRNKSGSWCSSPYISLHIRNPRKQDSTRPRVQRLSTILTQSSCAQAVEEARGSSGMPGWLSAAVTSPLSRGSRSFESVISPLPYALTFRTDIKVCLLNYQRNGTL